MRLRTIVTLLALLAILSTTVGGFSYYYSLRRSAYTMARKAAAGRTEMLKNQISSFLSENLKPVKSVAGLNEIRRAVSHQSASSLAEANYILDHIRDTLEIDVCYLMNQRGVTIASSNRLDPDSFIGRNFSFRPYFQEAIQGRPAKYLALGTASQKRGAYYSHPVYGQEGQGPLGVVVIKAPIRIMEKNIMLAAEGITLLTGPHGVIFSSSRDDWLYQTLWRLSPAELELIRSSRQFGSDPWDWVGLTMNEDQTATGPRGSRYLVNTTEIDNYSGWRVTHLTDIEDLAETLFKPLARNTSLAVLALCFFVGLAVNFLFRKAGLEIKRRKSAEEELRKSEERYRSLYHNTPAMLHSIDSEGRLVSVSDYWSEALGYAPEEVVGRKLTDFLTEESRQLVEKKTLPRFFKEGVLKDVSHQFVTRDGRTIDVLLSAIADRDASGKIVRSLAVLVDITERKKAEAELKRAQEQLRNHSRDLERQVREKTLEISGFIQHTPAVVYMKDPEGRYILVNSRWEELFGQKKEEVIGRTVYDIFPFEFAEQFRQNDRQVLTGRSPYQVEEKFPHQDGIHIYLSVRFPILDESGEVSRLCGISVNITDLKKAQDKLRSLSGSIMANQEKERTAIARELHDELGQVLTALRMDAVWLRERLSSADAKGAERAGDMCRLIDQTITEVGGIATRLRPAALDDLGLIDALDWHTTDFEKRTGIVCAFKSLNVPRIKGVSAIAVYRIAQEALTNVARHAEASHVDVALEVNNGNLILSVTDNGRGFDPEQQIEKEELGLTGMRERALLVGGDLSIESKSGGGTRVVFTQPAAFPEGTTS